MFAKTLVSGTIRGSFIVDMTTSPIIDIDGSNRIKSIKSLVNNYTMKQRSDSLKPIYQNNSIKSNTTSQVLRITPYPIINTSFTVCVVGNNKLNPLWLYALPRFNSELNARYLFVNNPISIRNATNLTVNTLTFNDYKDRIIGEHRYILTANGTNIMCYVDAVLVGTISIYDMTLLDLTYIGGVFNAQLIPEIRYIQVLQEYTANISALDTFMQTKLSGNNAPLASNVVYNTSVVTTGTVVTITSYTYTDSESDAADTPRYHWLFSMNGGTTWQSMNLTTQSITMPSGYAGFLIKGGVMAVSSAGNYASGIFVYGSNLNVT